MRHGGDKLSYKDYYDGELLDFSSNINPLGPPAGLRDYLFENFKEVESYPDIEYRILRDSVADYLGASREHIIVGNGAMEIIDNLAFLGKRVVTTVPAFSEYGIRAGIHKKELLEIAYLDSGLDLQEFERQLRPGDLVILGNPNNPTGLRLELDQLLRLYKLVGERSCFLLLDEAFFEFAGDDYDSIEIFSEKNYENIAIIRAATKFFGLPGLRLGYAVLNPDLAEKVRSQQLSWSVNTFADLAGRYIFKDRAYIEESRAYMEGERQYLLGELRTIDGLKVYNTQANYILLELLNRQEDYVFQELLRAGILVRKCSSYRVLSNNHIRIAIRTREENKRLVGELRKLEL